MPMARDARHHLSGSSSRARRKTLSASSSRCCSATIQPRVIQHIAAVQLPLCSTCSWLAAAHLLLNQKCILDSWLEHIPLESGYTSSSNLVTPHHSPPAAHLPAPAQPSEAEHLVSWLALLLSCCLAMLPRLAPAASSPTLPPITTRCAGSGVLVHGARSGGGPRGLGGQERKTDVTMAT